MKPADKIAVRIFDFSSGAPRQKDASRLTVLTVLTGPKDPQVISNVSGLKRAEIAVTSGSGMAFQLFFSGPAVPGAGKPADPRSAVTAQFGLLDRVRCKLWLNGEESLLAEGVVTHRELTSAGSFGEWQMTITGEDLSVLMDLKEKAAEHPQMNAAETAKKILDGYVTEKVISKVIAPGGGDRPARTERIPVQRGTDRAYLSRLAKHCGHVFEVVADGGGSSANWGPRRWVTKKFPPISLGEKDRNVQQLTYRHDALAAVRVDGLVQDAVTGAVVPVRTPATPGPATRTVLFPESGRTAAQAFARAQGMVAAAPDAEVVTGEVNTTWYPTVLVPGGVVQVGGAGFGIDGDYFIQRVVHVLEGGGAHTQRFTLTRGGA
ncbi:hypothetical protein [Catenuloplanes japonicus]|uniref:hypothetical protein n=1 Tax=Catenuloplanes japonicus TaxID=33876 RepID=UPI00068F0CF2|nr:hypothetical protein [Catenuloplanes japonicus]